MMVDLRAVCTRLRALKDLSEEQQSAKNSQKNTDVGIIG